jgi:hypothetical protein
MKCGPQADKFGKFIITKMFDEAIGAYDGLARSHWKAPTLQQLQADLAALTPEQRDIVRQCVIEAIGSALHSFLFALGEAHDFGEGIALLVDGVNIVEQSDGLHGEPYGPDGWLAKYSKYPAG